MNASDMRETSGDPISVIYQLVELADVEEETTFEVGEIFSNEKSKDCCLFWELLYALMCKLVGAMARTLLSPPFPNMFTP